MHLHGAACAGGPESPDGSPWIVGDERFATNPRYEVPDALWAVFPFWRAARGGGFGAGNLPEPGGTFDQAAAMMDAFDVLDAAHEEFRERRG